MRSKELVSEYTRIFKNLKAGREAIYHRPDKVACLVYHDKTSAEDRAALREILNEMCEVHSKLDAIYGPAIGKAVIEDIKYKGFKL